MEGDPCKKCMFSDVTPGVTARKATQRPAGSENDEVNQDVDQHVFEPVPDVFRKDYHQQQGDKHCGRADDPFGFGCHNIGVFRVYIVSGFYSRTEARDGEGNNLLSRYRFFVVLRTLQNDKGAFTSFHRPTTASSSSAVTGILRSPNMRLPAAVTSKSSSIRIPPKSR